MRCISSCCLFSQQDSCLLVWHNTCPPRPAERSLLIFKTHVKIRYEIRNYQLHDKRSIISSETVRVKSVYHIFVLIEGDLPCKRPITPDRGLLRAVCIFHPFHNRCTMYEAASIEITKLRITSLIIHHTLVGSTAQGERNRGSSRLMNSSEPDSEEGL
jgi:hypothetical protein